MNIHYGVNKNKMTFADLENGDLFATKENKICIKGQMNGDHYAVDISSGNIREIFGTEEIRVYHDSITIDPTKFS